MAADWVGRGFNPGNLQRSKMTGALAPAVCFSLLMAVFCTIVAEKTVTVPYYL
jgi:hypothetical protein